MEFNLFVDAALLIVEAVHLAHAVQALILKVFACKVVSGGVPEAARHDAHGLPNLLTDGDLRAGRGTKDSQEENKKERK